MVLGSGVQVLSDVVFLLNLFYCNTILASMPKLSTLGKPRMRVYHRRSQIPRVVGTLEVNISWSYFAIHYDAIQECQHCQLCVITEKIQSDWLKKSFQ